MMAFQISDLKRCPQRLQNKAHAAASIHFFNLLGGCFASCIVVMCVSLAYAALELAVSITSSPSPSIYGTQRLYGCGTTQGGGDAKN